ncbi:uncharacterized membrane-anchored protein YhcB (DUF1043 family) [Bacillus mesophilus]|uniref:Uncharacterized protein n=1 Tax=Bacillus mesophilus TaxID=1808955 RepID=A0A6M0Q6F6_9BACI|nr:hypothetical protein [Bacillus mesophilus]MBM7660529.1 uncharacterized membrane-anchored protein YhcB (DUF1043 family) [Bacillus mesophilus]NEY71922.1 hypothetical protein [Bacillus mesophilus]
MFWVVVVIGVISVLVFGYLMDRRTDRYKTLSDKKVKEGIESIKDDTQKHNPTNINHNGPF